MIYLMQFVRILPQQRGKIPILGMISFAGVLNIYLAIALMNKYYTALTFWKKSYLFILKKHRLVRKMLRMVFR